MKRRVVKRANRRAIRPTGRHGIYVGLMSGTSLDGVDAVVAEFSHRGPKLLGNAHTPFAPALRSELLELSVPGADELDRAAVLGNRLAHLYAEAVERALASGAVPRDAVRAVGCHGQTVRHRPERGYTLQIGNPALLAELCGLTVVADFRSRDLAAGGQGAPLVPAFHARVLGSRREDRAVLNLGGIANLSWLARNGTVTGFDCGPGNCLLDSWAAKHLGRPLDEDGAWGASGEVDAPLLARLLADPFFAASPPKSTGREYFSDAWLAAHLAVPAGQSPRDPRAVQATLIELSAQTAVRACRDHCGVPTRVLVCGGGAYNGALLRRLVALFAPSRVDTTAAVGLDPSLVEATAFAWLACQAIHGIAAGLPSVTGARGPRILGAIYPK